MLSATERTETRVLETPGNKPVSYSAGIANMDQLRQLHVPRIPRPDRATLARRNQYPEHR